MFTRDQIEEIKKKLIMLGTKDTQFPDAHKLNGEEIVAIVQDGENKKIPLSSIINDDFINVSKDTTEILTLSTAVSKIDTNNRKLGQVITFKDSANSWAIRQFTGSSLDNWNDIPLWKSISGIDELKSQVESNAEDISVLSDEIERHDASILNLNTDVSKLKDKDIETSSSLSELNTKVDTLKSQSDTNTSNISSLNTEVSALQSKVDANTTSISQINNTISDHEESITQINTKLEEHTESINAKITTDRIEDGAVTSEKIATTAFDSTLSVSGKIAPANVVGEKITELKGKVDALALGAFYGYFPDSSSLPTDVATPGYAYVGLDNPYKIWKFNGELWSNSGTAIDMNDADEEDITRNSEGKLQFNDRAYGDGMGYVILRKDKTFAEQVTQANTIYEIRYNFDLKSAEIRIPEGCILKFAGGSIKNCSNLVGYDTLVLSSPCQIFDSVLSGTWNVQNLYPEWFGAKNDGITDSTQALQMAIDFAHKINGCQIKLSKGKYLVSNTLYLYRKVSILGCGGFCQTLNSQMDTTTQIICNFSNSNSWCFDTYGWGTLAEYNDIFFFNNEKKSDYERNNSIVLKDFSIACPRQKPIYGAIRLWNSLQGLIENVSIYGTIFGICITESWAMCIKNCFIGTYRYGIGFGEYCTTDTVINVYLSRHRWTLPIDFVLPVVDDNFYPPYIAEKNEDGTYKELTELIKKNFSSAFLFSGKNSISKICIISPTIEHYECAFCGSRYTGEVTNLYLEGFATPSLTTRTKYVAWIGTKDVGSYQATFSISGHNGAAPRYEKTKYTYGSIGTGIHVKNSWFGTCYTPTNKYNPIAMSKMYIFEAPLNNSLPFYDEYDIENQESAIACPMKIIKGYDTVFAANSGVASNINNIALDVNNRVPLHEAWKRCCEYNIDRVVLVSYVTLEKPVNELKNKTIKFYNSATNEVSSITLDDYPLKINNSELQFISDGRSMILRSTKKLNYAIEVKGNCSIKSIGENNNIFTGVSHDGVQCLLHVVGDSDVTITCDSQDDLTYKLADDRLLFDRNVPYKYSIKVYHKNGLFLKELCNYKGTTTNRPNFTGIQGSVGFEYYDSDLKKKILWNGTNWVNLDGTEL